MTSLRELSPSERSKLRHFIRKYLRKLSAEQIAEKVKEEFGYEFKPSQIYRLARPEKKTVKIDRDVAEMLEEEFGSVSKGIKQLIGLARRSLPKPPPHLRKAIAQLALSAHLASASIALYLGFSRWWGLLPACSGMCLMAYGIWQQLRR